MRPLSQSIQLVQPYEYRLHVGDRRWFNYGDLQTLAVRILGGVVPKTTLDTWIKKADILNKGERRVRKRPYSREDYAAFCTFCLCRSLPDFSSMAATELYFTLTTENYDA